MEFYIKMLQRPEQKPTQRLRFDPEYYLSVFQYQKFKSEAERVFAEYFALTSEI